MTRGEQCSVLKRVLAVFLLSQSIFFAVTCARDEEQKNYYPPDPHSGTGSPPADSTSPHHGSGGGHGSAVPSHGGAGCTSPPHDPHTPSHTTPTPSTPSYTPTPSVPSHTPSYTPTPSTPSYTPTPSVPSHTPSTPSVPSITPATPFFDPNHPFTGTCTYWMNHPTIVWGVMGWWGTLGSAFGGHGVSGFPSSLTLPQALSNTRTDGVGALYREGTASLLNSMVNTRFPLSTQQVRDSFLAALRSDTAAAAQAGVFRLANEGHLNPQP